MFRNILIFSLFSSVYAWTRVADERMPGELRVANEGLSHDDNYWYLTNKHFIYQVDKQPMKIIQSNHYAIPSELTEQGYDHIGDIEVNNGVLYGGVEGGPTGIIGCWNTTTLEMINYIKITEQKGMPWVTVNPNTNLLYTSEWSNTERIHIYDTANNCAYMGYLIIANPEEYPKEVQGASFYNNELYISTNINDGIYKIDINSGISEFVFNDDNNYLPDEYYYEMEGLTFWDLSNDGLGLMHMYGNFMNAREKAVHNFDL